MKAKAKIALIDGLPSKEIKNVRVIRLSSTKYLWDSEKIGVPEFRRHSDKMIRTIREVNPNAQILLYPFFPKFNSIKENYRLLAKNIEKAVEFGCDIICICMEVLGVRYLSSDIKKAYEKASNLGIVICVSAGNNLPFQNPLIHRKYTVPVVGLTLDHKIPPHLKPKKPKNGVFGVGIYGGRNPSLEKVSERVYCSTATARFCGLLSKIIALQEDTIDLININRQFKKYTRETCNDIFSFNHKFKYYGSAATAQTSNPTRRRNTF